MSGSGRTLEEVRRKEGFRGGVTDSWEDDGPSDRRGGAARAEVRWTRGGFAIRGGCQSFQSSGWWQPSQGAQS